MTRLDTTVVDLHRVPRRPLPVLGISGLVWRVRDAAEPGEPLSVGEALAVGDTVVLEPGAEVILETLVLLGGARGCAHALVPEDAFKTSPSREDVPKLLEQLERLERQVHAQDGEDPLAEQPGPTSPFERALSSEFALQNLSSAAAELLPEAIARREGAVVLFLHGDAACVAMTQMSVRRVRALMAALERPVNPHLVDDETLAVLMAMVYGARTRAD